MSSRMPKSMLLEAAVPKIGPWAGLEPSCGAQLVARNRAFCAFPPALPTLARVRLQRLSPIGNRRNRPAAAENAANFFRSSTRAGGGQTSWFGHVNGDDKRPAILFVASDEPALKCFHLFKKWGRDAAGDIVKLA